MRLAAVLTTLLMIAISPKSSQACGGDGDACPLPTGSYHALKPQTPPLTPDGYPALLFFHGAGQSGDQVLRNNAAMVQRFIESGYAVLLPNGTKRPNSRFGRGWSFLPQRQAVRDELAFTQSLIADATERFDVDPKAILLSGYSIGGSLTWYLACKDHTLAAAYAPIAGGFWRPLPTTCDGPIHMLHTHGWRDQTVPLEGRPTRSANIFQGDIFAGLAVWREVNGCHGLRADEFETTNDFWRRRWLRCDPQTALEFALHPGGHNVPSGWAEIAIDWFDTIRSVN